MQPRRGVAQWRLCRIESRYWGKIGYLITEATSVWLTTGRGAVVAGHPLAYDPQSGFGLVLPLGKLGAPALPRGPAAHCEIGDDVVVAGLASGGPAERAGLKVSDVVLEKAGVGVRGLAELFRSIWRLGAAGCEVPLTIARSGARINVRLKSADRADFLKRPSLH